MAPYICSFSPPLVNLSAIDFPLLLQSFYFDCESFVSPQTKRGGKFLAIGLRIMET